MIDDEELSSIVQREAEQALNYSDATYSDERIKALEYYHGEKFGNEEVGRSQVVSRDVADVIDHMLPQLMRIFASSDYVRFAPRGPEDVAAADQASDLANYILDTENHGFTLMHNWFKDALLNKAGVIKAYWDERERVEERTFEGLTEQELQALLADDTVDIISQDIRVIQEAEIETITENVVAEAVNEFDVTIKRRISDGRVKLDLIPPEEFLIDTRAKSLEDARFVAHRTLVTVSDLVAMGYDRDEVEEHAGGADERHAQERQGRFQDLDGGLENDAADDTLAEVVYTEAFLQVDADEDGIAETMRVCTIGEDYHVVRSEYSDTAPFALLSPVLMPHRAIGQSIAEKLFDIQLTKSALLRSTLDNVYLTNNSRVLALEGAANLDDLMTNRPGGIVRVRQMGAVQPLTVPQVGRDAMAAIQYMDQVKEERTGISKASMGLDPDALQSATATAVAATVSAGQSQIEMIARVFAETGIKDLFRLILRLITQYQDEPKLIRLRNEFVPIDPRGWDAEMDVTINVGLGTGQAQEKMQFLAQIAGKQEQLLQTMGQNNPMVTLPQYAATLEKMIEAAGFKDTETFVNRPSQVKQIAQQMAQQAAQNQQPQLDPVAQAELQMKQMEAQARIEDSRARMEMEREKITAEMALARAKMEAEIQLNREKAFAQIDLWRAELAEEANLEAIKMSAGLPGGQGNINMNNR
ncbi:MAG: hypothetical protein O2795_17730 [Acidobacteria bacterium]|nr:hypothetical protein [Acidobacteriota bacterium]